MTKIIILNPPTNTESVKVELQGRVHGQFHADDEYSLAPGECREVEISTEQTIQVLP